MRTPLPAHTRRSLSAAAMLLAFATTLAPSVRAQTPAAPPSDPSAAQGDVVVLTPFEVNAGPSRGYAPSETMTGTRVATQIKDLPFNVSVITSEFFNDFAFFELGDNVAYISSFSNLDQGGGFNLRGFGASYQLRDGFFRLGRYGSSNIDRIEVIKGPSAAIYGQSSPGGIVNMISKKPTKTNSFRASISAGSYDTNRETVEANIVSGENGSTRALFIGGYYHRDYETPLAELKNREAYIALQHDFSQSSNLLLQVEYFTRTQDAPTSGAPEIQDARNTAVPANARKYIGIYNPGATIQQLGPNSELTRGMTAFTATYNTTFNPIFSARISGNFYRACRFDFNQNVGGTTALLNPNGTLTVQRGAAPTQGSINEDGGGIQADLLAHYWMFNRKVENRELLTFDFSDYYRYDPTLTLTNPALLATWTPLRTFTIGGATPGYYLTPFNSADYRFTRKNKNRTTDWGGLYRHQSGFFNGKLLVYLGLRFDYIIYDLRDFVANRQAHFTDTALAPSFGANFKITKDIALYANRANGFTPNAQTANAASLLPAEKNYGYDYGVKAGLFDNKLNFTLGGYYIVRKNVSVQQLNDQGVLVNVAGGSWLVRGLEFDANYSVTQNLALGGGYGHVNSEITDLGYKFATIGRTPARIPSDNLGVWIKYTFTGALKGLSANLGYTYIGVSHPENPDAGDTYNTTNPNNIILTASTNQWALTTPGYSTLNGGIRYQFTTNKWRKLTHTVGLNINNILDKNYIAMTRQQGDLFSWFVNYTLKY